MAPTEHGKPHRARRTSWPARLRKPLATIAVLGFLLALATPHPASTATPRLQPAASAILDKPAPSGRKQIQVGEYADVDSWYQNPIAQIAYVYRMASNSIQYSTGRNVAIGFVDITGLDNLNTSGYRVVDSAGLKTSDPALYNALDMANRPDVQRFVIVPDGNQAAGIGSGGGVHTEPSVILNDLANLSPSDGGASITPSRLFAMYSDYSPCGPTSANCAAWIPSKTDVYYGVDYSKSQRVRNALLLKYLNAATAQTEGSSAYKAARQAQKTLNAQAKQAAPARARALKAVQNGDLTGERQKRLFQLAAKGYYLCDGKLVREAAGPCPSASASASSTVSASTSDNSFAQVLSQPNVASPGGIDFSKIQLDYLSDPGDGSGLQYEFSAPTSLTDGGSSSGALDTAGLASAAFFVWLELDTSADWVNLNPTEPNRIVDSQMGRTDVGRIMLQADLALKKDVGKLIYPNSSLGKTFWSELEGGCFASRVWVVPSTAQVYTTGDKLYILKAPLDVKMEADYLQMPKGQTASVSCPKQDAATQAHNEALYRNLVLPKLVNMVNTDSSFADLRTIYRSRVAAEWYRTLSESRHTTYASLIDAGDVSQWTTTTAWTPEQTYQQYVTSYSKGEWHVTNTVNKGNYTYEYDYTYGGVDLTSVPIQKVSNATFAAEDPSLAASVSQSLTTPTTTADSGTVMFGSPTPLQAAKAALAAQTPVRAESAPLGTTLIRWLPLLTLLLVPAAPLVPLVGIGPWGRDRRLRRRTSRATRAAQGTQATPGTQVTSATPMTQGAPVTPVTPPVTQPTPPMQQTQQVHPVQPMQPTRPAQPTPPTQPTLPTPPTKTRSDRQSPPSGPHGPTWA